MRAVEAVHPPVVPVVALLRLPVVVPVVVRLVVPLRVVHLRVVRPVAPVLPAVPVHLPLLQAG